MNDVIVFPTFAFYMKSFSFSAYTFGYVSVLEHLF